MGIWDKFLSWLGLLGKKVNVVVVGLDNSGKTTIIERLKPPEKRSIEVAPTVGFTVDEFKKGVVCKDEMDNMLKHPSLRKVPIVFFANKKDLPTALTPVEVAQALRLEEIKDRAWQIVPSNALTGEGIDKGTDWLAEKLQGN